MSPGATLDSGGGAKTARQRTSAPARPLPCGLSARLKAEPEAYRRELRQLQLEMARRRVRT